MLTEVRKEPTSVGGTRTRRCNNKATTFALPISVTID
jgi:hypothetical protein